MNKDGKELFYILMVTLVLIIGFLLYLATKVPNTDTECRVIGQYGQQVCTVGGER